MTTTINASTSAGLVQTADTSGSLALQTASTTALSISASQVVTLTNALPVASGGTGGTTSTGSGAVVLGTSPTITTPTISSLSSASATALTLQSAGTTAITIDTSQNVGINGQDSAAKVYMAFNPASQVGLAFAVSSGTFTNPYVRFNNSAGNTIGTISSNNSTVTYGSTSDYRVKTNIQPISGALAKVTQLKPVTYDWKPEFAEGNSQGFIAHELAEVVPDCVTGQKDAVDADGNPVYQGIDTSFLVATLTAAIQEQQALITAQAETINALTARIVALEAK
jgi:hypothetical protein